MRILAGIVAFAVSGTALAQERSDDWDILVQPENRLTMAYVDFGNALSIGVRCVDGSYEAILTGLPPAPDLDRRVIMLQFADDESAYPTRWNVAIDPAVAVSENPAAFARDLRQGGQVQVTVPEGADDGRNLRYVLPLPSQHASIDQTLQACGKPLEDPRDLELAALGDTGLPGGITWARPPRPSYPDRGGRPYVRGFAVVTCLSQPDGSVRACEVEAEHPRDGGFGQSALDSVRRARLENTANPGEAVPMRKILFRADFRMETDTDAALRERTPSRIPRMQQ